MTELYYIDRSTTCLLPIGLLKDDKYHREVSFDKWRGEDHERLTTPAGKKNPGRIITDILCRLIQEIPGVLPRKADPWSLAPKSVIDDMFSADRDFLILQTLAASKRNTVQVMEVACQHCGADLEEDIDLCEIEVMPYGSGPPFVEFVLEDGIDVKNMEEEVVTARKGKFYLPTCKVTEMIAKSGAQGELAQFTEMIAACVRDFEVTGSITPLMAKRKMTLDDRNDLLEHVNGMSSGANIRHKVECFACSEESEVAIEVARFFF